MYVHVTWVDGTEIITHVLNVVIILGCAGCCLLRMPTRFASLSSARKVFRAEEVLDRLPLNKLIKHRPFLKKCCHCNRNFLSDSSHKAASIGLLN